MGIFRDLVSNYANSKMQEQQMQLAHNLALGDVLTTLIQNPETDAPTFAKASTLYQSLLNKHGGKEGRAIQDQIGQLLQGYGAARAKDRAAQADGGDQGPPDRTQPQQGEPTVAPGSADLRGWRAVPQPPPMPPGQSAGQPGGVNYGWPTAAQATPATLTGTEPEGAQAGRQPAPAQRGGFGRVLGGLAGVGREMLGMPRQEGGILPTPQQIARIYGPTEVQQARTKERGVLAAQSMDRQQFRQRIDEDVANKLMTEDEAKKAKADYDLGMQPPGARTTREAQVPLATQAFELAKRSMAKRLYGDENHPLTVDQERQALTDSRPMPENKIEDRDALDAYAEKVAAKDPAREQKLGRTMTGEDLKPGEKLDARMAWAKQKAMRGETLPGEADLRAMVEYDLITGKTTAMGMGASDPFRRAYQNMRAQIISERGARFVAEQQAGFRSDAASLTNLQKMTDAITAWESTAKLNLGQALQLSRQVGRTGSSLANEYQQYLQGKLEDYPLLAKFRVAVETGAAEYTKVMYSATPSGGTAKDQRDVSHSLLNTAMADGTLNGAIEQMRIDMSNRFDTLNQQIGFIKGRMRTGVEGGAQGGGQDGNVPTITNPADKAKLPSGTLYRDPEGNIRRKR